MATDPLSELPTKDRTASSGAILDKWVSDAEQLMPHTNTRIGWLLSSTILVAALQRELANDDQPLFVLKGGMFIERALNMSGRATKDIDTLYRGAIENFEATLDNAFARQWGVIRITRGPIVTIDNTTRMKKPQRVKVTLSINGKPWRNIKLEVAFPEGNITNQVGFIAAPSLRFFGFENPQGLATIALSYQVAQKLHASTDPTTMDGRRNTRVRDIADLILIRNYFYTRDADLTEVRGASEDVFRSRADEAIRLGLTPRLWPPTVVAHEGWVQEWEALANKVGLNLTLREALSQLNDWITQIHAGDQFTSPKSKA